MCARVKQFFFLCEDLNKEVERKKRRKETKNQEIVSQRINDNDHVCFKLCENSVRCFWLNAHPKMKYPPIDARQFH